MSGKWMWKLKTGGGSQWALNPALNVVQINQHVNETLWGQIKEKTFCPSWKITPAHIWEFGWNGMRWDGLLMGFLLGHQATQFTQGNTKGQQQSRGRGTRHRASGRHLPETHISLIAF